MTILPTISPDMGAHNQEPIVYISNYHTMPKHCIIQVSFDDGETWTDQKDSRVNMPEGSDTVKARIVSTTPMVIDEQAEIIKKLRKKLKKLTRRLEIEKADNAELVGYGIELLKENKKLRVNPENMGGGE